MSATITDQAAPDVRREARKRSPAPPGRRIRGFVLSVEFSEALPVARHAVRGSLLGNSKRAAEFQQRPPALLPRVAGALRGERRPSSRDYNAPSSRTRRTGRGDGPNCFFDSRAHILIPPVLVDLWLLHFTGSLRPEDVVTVTPVPAAASCQQLWPLILFICFITSLLG